MKTEITKHHRLLEVFADLLEDGIRDAFSMVADPVEWVYSDEEARELMSRMRGIFVSSLCGEIEELLGKQSFSTMFTRLPDTPTVKSETPADKETTYWHEDMPSTSTPRGRAQVMWAIRIGFTHGNGLLSQISDPKVAAYLEPTFAPKHFRGVRVNDEGRIVLGGDVTRPAIFTTLEMKDLLSA